jgi:hypothetical protein
MKKLILIISILCISNCHKKASETDLLNKANPEGKYGTEIWFGKEFQAARKALLGNDRNGHPMCKACDFVGVKGRFFPRLIA